MSTHLDYKINLRGSHEVSPLTKMTSCSTRAEDYPFILHTAASENLSVMLARVLAVMSSTHRQHHEGSKLLVIVNYFS